MKIPATASLLVLANALATVYTTRAVDLSRFEAHQPALRPAYTAQTVPATGLRFDHRVRADFFAGLRGDARAFERAMDACEKTLAADPKHAEALVWHGSGLLFQAGQAFGRGDIPRGSDLWDRGLREMDEAVALAPASVAVLIPRGATLLEVSRSVPTAQGMFLLEKALSDYEKVLTLQRPMFNKLSAHGRGELLFGLAEGWARKGDQARARRYFEQILMDAQGSGQEGRARAWLETGKAPEDTGCIGCH